MLLKSGSTGSDVTNWQNFLNNQSYNAGVADGIFGNNTVNATKSFQSDQGLISDGIVGSGTLAKATELGYASVSSAFPPSGTLNIVVDISHFQSDVDFTKVAGDGIKGVIHKATQGSGYTDPEYGSKRIACSAAGLKWGAYHFGTGQDVSLQADHFISVADADENTLLVLDWEENSIASQGTMSLDQAVDFVKIIQEKTGRWPVLYGGSLIKQQVGSSGNDTLKLCPLWLAQYTQNPTLPSGWDAYHMWQYTDGNNGPEPHSINGIGNCDRDVFRGAESDLEAFWKSGL